MFTKHKTCREYDLAGLFLDNRYAQIKSDEEAGSGGSIGEALRSFASATVSLQIALKAI